MDHDPATTGAAGPRRLGKRVLHEIKQVACVTLYFAVCFLVMMACKKLILEEYGVEIRGLSLAMVGALVAAKVVVILEKVPLGGWVRSRPVAADVGLRTLLYTLGVAAVLLLEKAFESRHEHGGFLPALEVIFHHRDIHHVWATTIAVSGALLGFIVYSVLSRHLGEGSLAALFFRTPSEEVGRPGRR